MTEGFCILEKIDVPVDAERRCLADGMVAIPPSYGKRTQVWRDGNWSPPIDPPSGYRYTPKFSDAPSVVAEPVLAECQLDSCGATYSYLPRGGDPPRYCSSTCKRKATNARRREGRAS